MPVQLDTKTVYSFMDSMITIDSYVARAKEMGYTHLAIMDRDNLYAAYSFMEACETVGIKPIIGCEMELDYQPLDKKIVVQLIARNTQGYKDLLKISTAKMMGNSDFSIVEPYLANIAMIIPYFEGIEHLDLEVDFYIGVYESTPQLDFHRPLIPLHTVRYFKEEQVEVLQVLHAIQQNVPLNQVSHILHHQSFISPESLAAKFALFPEAIDELHQLVSAISYHLDRTLKLPRFNRKRLAVEELREKAEEGLKSRGLVTPIYQERLERELAVIHQMGFDDYFLIVWDLLRFGRSQHYYMGMGRGSAVGSLVAYALSITGIDPVKHNLLFERFLNVERFSMPDIDIDIPDIHRGDFIRYVRERYGTFHAAQIVTYSTFGAKQALRDVLKRYGVPEYEITNLTKKISFRDTLSTAYEKNASFRQVINSKIEYQRAYTIALQIEGQPRQTSIHAAGVVMSDEELTDTIPLKKGDDMLITQYDAHAVEENGLLKMDFLGLRNLTFVQKMAEAIEKTYGKKFVISEIDLEDKDTLALFAKGWTKGIFQFEQPGAIHLLRRVQPSCFEEIVATTSLNRPGASDYADNFVRRKHGKEPVDLLDDSIASILKPTYGIMLYQEQVMQIAQYYAGFTLGKADLLRRAMSKKNKLEMQNMEADFVAGAIENGHNKEKASVIFSMMAKFAGYGFNRSHAYAYSALAFQLAYIKTHYPDIFFTVMFNYSSSDYITDALQFDFQVAPLSVNSIPYHDKVEHQTIYMGLKNIKGLPKELFFWIIEERPFKSVEDFILRLPASFKKKDFLKPLIQLGLFDVFETNRRKILENLDSLFVFADAFGTFFSEEDYSWIEADDYTDSEKFQLEQEIIGVGLSPHPLVTLAKSSNKPYTPFSELTVGMPATILGEVENIRVIRTKKTGQQMAFIQVTDTKKKLDVTVFPDTYQRYHSFLEKGNIFYLTGKVQEREGQLQLVLETVETVDTEKYWILLANQEHDREIATILSEYPGTIPVVVHYQDSNKTIQLEHLFVAKSLELQERLAEISMKTVFQ